MRPSPFSTVPRASWRPARWMATTPGAAAAAGSGFSGAAATDPASRMADSTRRLVRTITQAYSFAVPPARWWLLARVCTVTATVAERPWPRDRGRETVAERPWPGLRQPRPVSRRAPAELALAPAGCRAVGFVSPRISVRPRVRGGAVSPARRGSEKNEGEAHDE